MALFPASGGSGSGTLLPVTYPTTSLPSATQTIIATANASVGHTYLVVASCSFTSHSSNTNIIEQIKLGSDVKSITRAINVSGSGAAMCVSAIIEVTSSTSTSIDFYAYDTSATTVSNVNMQVYQLS